MPPEGPVIRRVARPEAGDRYAARLTPAIPAGPALDLHNQYGLAPLDLTSATRSFAGGRVRSPSGVAGGPGHPAADMRG